MKKVLHRLIYLLCLGVVAFGLTFACSPSRDQNARSPSPSAEPCRIVQHVRGESCIPLKPKRIVTLDFNSLAAVLALDIKPISSWITTEIEAEFPYFEGKTNGVEIVRGSSGQINLEKLLLLHPDLIVVISHPVFERVYQQLSHIAPTIVLPWVETKGDWKHHLKETARVFEIKAIAGNVMEDYYHRVEQLKGLLSDLQSLPRVSFAYIASGRLVIARQKSFAGGVLNDIGLLNPLFEDSGDIDLPISEELLPAIDSDVLFIAPLRKDDNSVIERLQQKPLWSKLKAAQNNQVYVVDFSVWRGLNIFAAHGMLDDLEKYLVRQGE